MKIHFFIPDLTVGGAERVFSTLCRLWDRERDDLTLVVLRREGTYFETLPPDFRVVNLEAPRLLSAIPRLRALWKKERPDVVLATQAHVNALVGWLSLALPKVRFVGRETSVPSQARRMNSRSAFAEFFYRAGYRRLHRIVCPSSNVADELERTYGVSADRLRTVANPVDIETIVQQSREPLPQDFASRLQGKKVFVASGRLETVKGFDLLLQAVKLLPEEYQFVILGDGRQKDALITERARLGLENRVWFQGFEPNPHRWLSNATGFVLSSRYEGFPNAVLEALILGLPIAAFRCPGGVVEIVQESVNGALAEPNDPESLGAAIRRVGEATWDKDLLARSSREQYGGTEIVRQYRRVLEEVVNG